MNEKKKKQQQQQQHKNESNCFQKQNKKLIKSAAYFSYLLNVFSSYFFVLCIIREFNREITQMHIQSLIYI